MVKSRLVMIGIDEGVCAASRHLPLCVPAGSNPRGRPHQVFPLNNVPGTVVTLMDTSNVDTVFVAGKVVKWHGSLIGVDLGRLRRMIEKSRDGVLARAGYAADLFGT